MRAASIAVLTSLLDLVIGLFCAQARSQTVSDHSSLQSSQPVPKIEVRLSLPRTLVALGSPAKRQSSKEAEVHQWVLEHYDQVVGELLPDVPKETDTGRDTQWILSVRVYDPQRPEFWFFIRKNYTSAITATIRVPEDESIYVQLGELWQAAPTDSPELLAKKVRLKEYNWTSDKVPELRKLVTEFESVKIAAEVSDALLSDPVVYHFRIGSRSGEEMRLTSHGPGPLPTPARQPNSLIQFVEDFRRFMDKQIRTESDKR
jgi:hypothetical protein